MASNSRQKNAEIKELRKSIRRRLVLMVMAGLCIYLAFNVVLVRWRLHKQQEQLQAVLEAIEIAKQENDELVRVMNGGEEEVIERIAREKLGYAAIGERVFEDISGIG